MDKGEAEKLANAMTVLSTRQIADRKSSVYSARRRRGTVSSPCLLISRTSTSQRSRTRGPGLNPSRIAAAKVRLIRSENTKLGHVVAIKALNDCAARWSASVVCTSLNVSESPVVCPPGWPLAASRALRVQGVGSRATGAAGRGCTATASAR